MRRELRPVLAGLDGSGDPSYNPLRLEGEAFVVFAVQCPNPKCKKYMLVEEHEQGKVVTCLLCRAAIKVGTLVANSPSSPPPRK